MSEATGESKTARSSRPLRVLRAALVALAMGAILLPAAASYAQRGFSMGRMGDGGRIGSGGSRFPGGGEGPRFPGRPGGGVIIPGGGYPGGPGTVIVDDGDDDPAPRRIRKIRDASAKQKPKTRQHQQSARRGGFNAPPAGETRFVPNEVLLKLSAAVTTPALNAITRRHRLTRLELQDFVLTRRRIMRVRIDDGRPVATVIRALQADGRILGAQPNYRYLLQQGAGATGNPAQYSLAKLHLPQAQAMVKGEGVLVAVVDSMIDAAHPDLEGAIAASFDATGTPDKPHAHGTGIAGVIAAHGKLLGAAPAVKLLAVHAFSSSGTDGSSMSLLKGLDWAGKENANIVNMSFAGPSDEEVHDMLVALRAKGAVPIAAVGNAGPKSRPLYPAAFPEVIAVTATDADDNVFEMSNRGTHIAVAAPGVAILAPAPDASVQMQTGTSFAAAQVSGVAALLLQRNRKLDAGAIRRILTSTAHDLGAPGHDDQFGSGLVDAYAAVMSAAPKSSDVSGSTPRGN
jgi:subtilisin family serine protease